MQVVGSSFYTEIAIDQWTRELPVKATRGEIIDYSGVVLAGNETAYTVYVRPRSVKDPKTVASVLS
ncbi:MAG: stage V sporulation protein D, partial [Clostridia bacterium]|nr:stage V sporulation protein D [Clostridia bacterium]